MELTHASFFSGVGGLDRGLEQAGWRTVSFSEIDPYASAVLAERWPGVPNLGDITHLARAEHDRRSDQRKAAGWQSNGSHPYHGATLWSGGFPCQDLSVAGKRAGFAGERSSLAFAFLDLVERHRPPAILLENVPGLLSSHRGRDMAALLGRLAELGYGVGYRILDARHFGVPQRRRRVFIVGLRPGRRAGAERAAEVLSVGSRCHRHPAAGVEAGEGVAGGAVPGVAFTLRRDPGGTTGQGWNTNYRLSPTSDSGGVRATDGMAGRVDDRERVAPIIASETGKGWWSVDVTTSAYRAQGGGTPHHAVIESVGPQTDSARPSVGSGRQAMALPDVLLPLGLDSHRYRCCGNGVVSNVSEWVGIRLARAVA